MIRDFARNILSIAASSNGDPVSLRKTEKSSWVAPAGLSQLQVEYEVYAWDLSVRAAHLDNTHGFFNGTSVFLGVVGQEHQSCHLQLLKPAGEIFATWRVATSLDLAPLDHAESTESAVPGMDSPNDGFGVYAAANYDELIDHPVEMGTFQRVQFNACGVLHELVLTGPCKTDTQQITDDLKIICEAQIRFFGEPAPMSRYVFLVMVVGSGYGGLEHRASTSLLVTRESLPVPGVVERSDEYIQFLGLCSHEYFHTWNVKRIKPARFVPYELATESYTELLWAFEGITSYYDDLFLVRCGLITRQQYLELLGKTITRVHRGSGRLRQSTAESSFDAWTKFYKQDENAPNAIVSYYAKGALIALALDMIIRQKSTHKHSLDDLMRTLWKRWLNNLAGVEQADFEAISAELSGENVDDFFRSAVFGTEDLDLQKAFEVVGLSLHWRAASSDDDAGGKKGNSESIRHVLGARLEDAPGVQKITQVFDDGAAQQAGLAAGDLLVALDHISVAETSVDKILARHALGEQLVAHVFRHGILMELLLEVMAAPVDTCWLSVDEDALEASAANGREEIQHWLAGSSSAALQPREH